MYVKIRRHQHTCVHAHTGPRRHARAPACHRDRHHIPRLVRSISQAGTHIYIYYYIFYIFYNY